MNWEFPPQDFRFILFDRTEPEKNACRFYLIGWMPTLLDERAVVRMFGRKGETQRVITAPFESLEAAWPLIRSVIKARLRHGYQVIAPDAYRLA
jgi:predicted DNA-binding WGR domain protein